MLFRREQLVLDWEGKPFGDAVEPWQERRIFAPLDERQEDGRYRYRLCYFELPRGHGKTTMVAGEAVAQLVFASRDWRGHIVAGDEDQARELFDAAKGFIRRNPLLEGSFTVLKDRIVASHTGATLRVHNADAPTAHGLIVDWVAFDEFWNQRSRDLWDAFYTATIKRPNWRAVIITTAGFDRATICWEVRELARKRDDFYAFIAPGQLASWISDEEVERMRATLPAHVFQRFVENKWVEGSGSFISREDLARCVDDRLGPKARGYPGNAYYVGVDLGLKRDRTAAAVVHRAVSEISPAGSVVLDDLAVWQGTRRRPVEIADVERWIEGAVGRFRPRKVLVDPWQAQATIQAFAGRWPIEEFAFTPQAVARLSSNLYHLIHAGQLRLYPDEELERELSALEAVQTSYGWRIDHKPGKHDDRAMALGIAALAAASEPAPGRTRISRANVSIGGGQRGRTLAVVSGRALFIDEDGQLASRPARPPGR
jgi:hypothetical protein